LWVRDSRPKLIRYRKIPLFQVISAVFAIGVTTSAPVTNFAAPDKKPA
jgi:hypothetical protein